MIDWFVLEVNFENENKILDILNSDLFLPCVKRSFILRRKQLKSFGTEWKIYEFDVLKGIIFLEICNLNLFKKTLVKCKEIFELNHHQKIKLKKLQEYDLLFLNKFNSTTIDHSTGDIVNGKIVVNEGPLKGCEDMIRKVDRHKRLAFFKYKFSFSDSDICLGLEIKNKTV
ncbi:hypothetical protein [Candidatus Stoquefichus sp. SB1]|uniref:hypothetical protein n=1 Tax=Candidatus Stoquefichus sp. SB1 TaxID=1658109 RepID=UPI00067F3AA6|nr:hypothetical protein [Candidatus Stoquefichus sp. SB1]